MPPKRKSDAFDADDTSSIKENDIDHAPIIKKARVSNASASTGKEKTKAPAKPLSWEDVELEGDEEVCVLFSIAYHAHMFTQRAAFPCSPTISRVLTLSWY